MAFESLTFTSYDSPLCRLVLGPFLNRVVTFLPRWLAPNAITVAGLAALALSAALAAWTSPRMTEPSPTWHFAFHAALLIFYQVRFCAHFCGFCVTRRPP